MTRFSSLAVLYLLKASYCMVQMFERSPLTNLCSLFWRGLLPVELQRNYRTHNR